MRTLLLLSAVALIPGISLIADDSVDTPRPVPLTRPEMKQYLEDMKARKPRIPLPELTEEEKAQYGERGPSYEGRIRSLYGGRSDDRPRPTEDRPRSADGQGRSSGGGGFFGGMGRDPDPNMTLDYKFKVQLFWIVSRTNNCQYCLGHQESKLLGAGMTEDEIAALDSNWLVFNSGEQAAYAFARKFTYEPHLLSDKDIDALRPHYTDLQILEMVLSMAGNNAINRWKEGAGVPQSSGGGNFGRRTADGTAPPAAAEERHTYLTATSEEYQDVVTKVAPLVLDPKTGKPTRQTVCNRPALEPRAAVERALAECRERTPRLPLVDEAQAREVLGEDAPEGPLPQWVRLLANFPVVGKGRVQSQLRAEQPGGNLSPLMKAQASWIVARQDRAWYAAGLARKRLLELGQTDDQIFQLDGDWSEFTSAERSMFTVARKLAATPVVLTDADVAEALEQTGPHEVVQMISYTTGLASFDRITEAAGLQLEQ